MIYIHKLLKVIFLATPFCVSEGLRYQLIVFLQIKAWEEQLQRL